MKFKYWIRDGNEIYEMPVISIVNIFVFHCWSLMKYKAVCLRSQGAKDSCLWLNFCMHCDSSYWSVELNYSQCWQCFVHFLFNFRNYMLIVLYLYNIQHFSIDIWTSSKTKLKENLQLLKSIMRQFPFAYSL